MKVKVIAEDCISCGLCVNNVPEVFSWDDDEKAEAITDEVAVDKEAATEDALNSCPTDAIEKV
ncbi:ferredoxin [Halanaerobacter jeridensis]|uniref:Ferredoxin n=1 Tax=Halanaerobacter jeridensis TaxID=706427 RepID=A0A938XPT7_9FIRM|nr:ferredoxin [Halanaerobacter jeridensis]MBM7557503.1 ferredoxin [Halanaerobacter jeridensis]